MPFSDTPAQPGRGGPSSAIPAFLCLGLLFVSRNLFACQLLLDPHLLAPGLGQAAGHYLLAVAFSIPLCFFLRSPGKSARLLRIVAAFPFVAGVLATLGYFHQATGWGLYVPPVFLGACFALFFPFTISLFFAFIPARRLGVCFGLAMAAGEFIWLLALPYISTSGSAPVAAHPFVAHLRAMQGLVHCAMGILLAYLIVGMRDTMPRRAAANAALRPLQDSFKELEQQKRLFLFWLFGISALLLFVFGIGLGSSFPKAAHRPALAEPLHYLMVVSLPLVGMLLDKGRAGSAVLLAFLVLCAFSVPIELFGGSLGPNGEFTPLLFMGRETLILCLFTHALLLSRRAFRPLAGSLAYAMYLVPFAGGLFAGTRAFSGEGLVPGPIITLVLAAAFTSISLALFFKAVRTPAVWLRDLPENSPEQGMMVQAGEQEIALGIAKTQAPLSEGAPLDSETEDFLPTDIDSLGIDSLGMDALEDEALYDEALDDEALDDDALDDEARKLRAFAFTFGLSKREIEVLQGIIKDLSPEGIAKEIGVRESTVRFHQTGLLKKTGQANRRLMTLFFHTWEPE